MKKRKTAFCIACDEDVEYMMFTERVETVVRGAKIRYVEVAAKCPVCEEELYVPEVNDVNVQARENAYRNATYLLN